MVALGLQCAIAEHMDAVIVGHDPAGDVPARRRVTGTAIKVETRSTCYT
jgi:hypothetical protein